MVICCYCCLYCLQVMKSFLVNVYNCNAYMYWKPTLVHHLNSMNMALIEIILFFFPAATFVNFLLQFESPYEVHDYIKLHMGDSPTTQEFTRQFLEKAKQCRQRKQPTSSAQSSNMSQVYVCNVLHVYGCMQAWMCTHVLCLVCVLPSYSCSYRWQNPN